VLLIALISSITSLTSLLYFEEEVFASIASLTVK